MNVKKLSSPEQGKPEENAPAVGQALLPRHHSSVKQHNEKSERCDISACCVLRHHPVCPEAMKLNAEMHVFS